MRENNDEKEKIIKDLEKTGFPLEIKVTSILETCGWVVHNQEGYLDPDDNKWRTIDIAARKWLDLPKSSAYDRLHVSLVIECKKSVRPWVFYVREKKGMRTFRPIAAFGVLKQESSPWLHPLHLTKWTDCLHSHSSDFENVAVIPYEAFSHGERQNIFKATNQVIKALDYEMERARRSHAMAEAKEKTSGKAFMKLLLIFYPLIIFDGNLYELTYHKGKPRLSPCEFVQYLVSYESPTIKDLFVIDTLKADFLEKYVRILDKEMLCLKKKVEFLESPSIPPKKKELR